MRKLEKEKNPELKVEILEEGKMLCYGCGQTFDFSKDEEFVRYLFHECFNWAGDNNK